MEELKRKIEELTLEGKHLRYIMNRLEEDVLRACLELGVKARVVPDIHTEGHPTLLVFINDKLLIIWRRPNTPDYFMGINGTRIKKSDLPKVIESLDRS